MKINNLNIACSSGERFNYEKNDCTVRAVSNSMGLPYETAHNILRQYAGRRKGKGIPFFLFIKKEQVKNMFLKEHNISYFEVPTDRLSTINRFCQERKQGTYLILVKGHITVVRDGVVLDLGAKNWRILTAWRVIKNSKA